MILISLAYILDYALNEKYSYESINCFNQTNNTDKDILNEDEDFNPYLELTITLKDDNFSLLVDWDDETQCMKKDHIDKYGRATYKIKEKFDNIQLFISFFCGEDKNCSSFNKYMELYARRAFSSIQIEYPGYKIDHYNDPPIYEDKARSFEKYFFYKKVIKRLFILLIGK